MNVTWEFINSIDTILHKSQYHRVVDLRSIKTCDTKLKIITGPENKLAWIVPYMYHLPDRADRGSLRELQ